MLVDLADWEAFLLAESGLPGPRGNLELAQAAASLGDLDRFEQYLGYTPELAPTNDPHEFLAFCGVLGLGYLAAEGQQELVERLRPFASDPRWRVREAVAMGLQRIGDRDKPFLLLVCQSWAQGRSFERRAVAAGLAEPRLLTDQALLDQAMVLFDGITAALEREENRRTEEFRVLRQGLGYAWSVLAAADFQQGKIYLERWFVSQDADIRWVMGENLKKNRLRRIDPQWVEYWRGRV